MDIIAVLGKGGTAKTTSTASIGHALARRGLNVVLVDLDSQASLSDWLVGEREEARMVEETLMGRATWSEVLVEVAENLRLAPTMNFALGEVEDHIAGLKRQSELFITHALESLEQTVAPDVVILDTPRGLDTKMALNIFEAMTHALIASEPSPMSLAALREIVAAVREYEEARGVPLLTGVLPTRYTRTSLSTMALDSLAENKSLRVLTPIRSTVRASEAVAVGDLLWDFEKKCTAAQDYETATDEIVAAMRAARSSSVTKVGIA
jgi:chromosome partitioning protein